MLAHLELEHAELSILLTDDPTIHALNREHRDKDKPTDVLAFPLDETEEPEPLEPPSKRSKASKLGDQNRAPRILGDVVISLDTAERQAASRKRPLADEVRFLLAHGLLHLIGYDHDTREHKREMDSMTRRLVRAAAAKASGEP